ncbi:Six-hairpin glycosidase-like protein [Crepidotus variabilis]|uniref:Six-hairpin glycosidase-like protein n=1 Tax=Crepidotus variabilis TaxID=179855 RepID=A0A9P6JWG3_9AGAR|nr:Six-hairpin glycosidase-like protein [Crepidotus variabilis]
MRFGYGSVLLASSLFVVSSTAQCPDYTSYSQSPHDPKSTGPLQLPYMRPSPECRTFNSSAVEQVITDMKNLLKDPDLARLFENTFPNTLDTTVKYYNKDQNLAFIITGVTQWLRDTANQFAHYHSLLTVDKELASLVKAVINNEARYVAEYPYCGSFQPPPESGLAPSHNDWADGVTVNPPVDNKTVFECKYEIDSLCGFIKLSRSYYESTGDSSFINDNWRSAIDQIFRVIHEQSQSTFDDNFNYVSYYNWTGGNRALSPMVPNHGNGEPKAYTGMVGTHHRPSDDLSVFAFLTPANAMLSVELKHLADVLEKVGQLPNITQEARTWSSRIHDAVWNETLVNNIFAYETNGMGARYVMDDANVPSLLSLPYLGFLEKDDPAYLATKKLIMSRKNPYYTQGKNVAFSGTGGPHVDAYHPWPMSQISLAFGSDDDAEIMQALYIVANNTNGLGLIHESQSIYDPNSYTRSWFAWANSYFAELILDLAERKPHLILKQDTPYKPGASSAPPSSSAPPASSVPPTPHGYGYGY